MAEKMGIIIIGHGSKRQEANDTLFQVAGELRIRLSMEEVEAAFFSLVQPDVPTVIDRLVVRGCQRVLAQPFFLFQGNHARVDVPQLLEACRRNHPGLQIDFLNTLGSDHRLVDMVEENVLQRLSLSCSAEGPDAASIEAASMKYIESRLSGRNIPFAHRPVVNRVIHTTADFDFARTLIFHSRAVEAGTEALSKGCNIIVDVNMVAAGITAKRSSPLVCAVHDPDVKEAAATAGSTRSAMAMEKLRGQMRGGVVAIGNAPTALFKVIEMVERGQAEPALIIGVPVGFVGAAESKAALAKLDHPHITNFGPRGGSPVAAAIVNALSIMVKEEGK